MIIPMLIQCWITEHGRLGGLYDYQHLKSVQSLAFEDYRDHRRTRFMFAKTQLM